MTSWGSTYSRMEQRPCSIRRRGEAGDGCPDRAGRGAARLTLDDPAEDDLVRVDVLDRCCSSRPRRAQTGRRSSRGWWSRCSRRLHLLLDARIAELGFRKKRSS